jgi:hypothetical protein
MSKQQAWILIVIAAVAVGALIQMNRYEFLVRNLAEDTFLVKIDRLTGRHCVASFPVAFDDKSSRRRFLERLDMPLC